MSEEATGIAAEPAEAEETTTADALFKDPKEDKQEDVAKQEAEQVGAPEEYTEFSMPEQGTIGGSVTDMMKELNLSQENAQKLVDAHFKDIENNEESATNEWETMKDAWWSDAKADPDIGGASFDESVAMARKGLNQFANTQALEVLQVTGADHHPAILKMFRDVGKALSEDKMLVGSSITPTSKSAAEHLFPGMTKT